MPAPSDREHLDDLLNRSSPATTTIDDQVTHELRQLQVATRQAAECGTPRRRWSRPALAGIAALLAFGGAGTAAVAGWVPERWLGPVEGSYTYTLPSGVECEEIVGDVRGSNPESIDIVKAFYREADYDDLLTDEAIAARIEADRKTQFQLKLPDGTLEPAGYGTRHYDADVEYRNAVHQILQDGVQAKLDAAGLREADPRLSYQGRSDCPGADQ